MNRKRIGILLMSLLLIATLVLPGCMTQKTVEKKEPEKTLSTPTEQVEKKNEAEPRAQDDFYEHVNGKLIQKKEKERAGQGWDSFEEVNSKVKEQLQTLGDEVAKDTSKHQSGSAEDAVSRLYKTAMDSKTREKVGLGSLEAYIKELQAANSISSYLEVVAKIRKELGKSSLLPFSVIPSPKDASKRALNLEEPMMLVSKMDLEDEQTREDIATYVKELLKIQGMEEEKALEWGKKLVSFYQEIGKVALSKKESSNVLLTTNLTTVEEMQEKLSKMDLRKFLKDSGQGEYSSWVQLNPNMLAVLNSFLDEDHLELLKQYSVVTLLNDYAPFLGESYGKAYAKFNQFEEKEAKEEAWEATQLLAEKEVGELYAKTFFTQEKKDKVTKLVLEIKEAYRKNMEKLDWLSPESRQEGIKKIDSMMVKIGYPDAYTSFVKGTVKSPEEGGSLIENALNISKAQAEAEIQKATAPVDRQQWGISPQTVNAYYDPSFNEIIFPAAMLQAPFFDEEASRAQNLGGFGAIVAHEMTHAFDDMGSHFDDQGNFRDWWTKEDREKFNERAKKYVRHFGSIEVLPGEKVDGELTLGENIADTGGVSVISSMLEDDQDALREMYRSYARIWATVIHEEELKGQLMGDEHAPSKVRVNGILSVTDAFYKAFSLEPGDKMYLKPEDRVKMF